MDLWNISHVNAGLEDLHTYFPRIFALFLTTYPSDRGRRVGLDAAREHRTVAKRLLDRRRRHTDVRRELDLYGDVPPRRLADAVVCDAVVGAAVLLLDGVDLEDVAPVLDAAGRQDGVVLPPPADRRPRRPQRVAQQFGGRVLLHDDGARRVVGDDRRFADPQLHVARHLVVDAEDDLTLVDRPVSPLHVF